MQLTKQQIKEAALRLVAADRETLAEDLLLSLGEDDRRSLEAAWLDEIRRRDSAEIIVGTNAKTAESVLSGIERKLSK